MARWQGKRNDRGMELTPHSATTPGTPAAGSLACEPFAGEPRWAAAALGTADLHAGVPLRPEERARADGYQQGRPRHDFVAGRILARVLAADLLNGVLPAGAARMRPEELELTQYCGRCDSKAHGSGRIRLPGTGRELAVSYARAAGWILLGLAPGGDLLGVDLVEITDGAFAGDAGRQLEDYAFALEEREILGRLPEPARRMARARAWALKEAVAKASGEGLAGEGGIPVVAGRKVHRVLGLASTRVRELPAGSRDPLGTRLPGNLLGTMLWSAREPA